MRGGWTHSSPCSASGRRRRSTARGSPSGGRPSTRRARSRAASARRPRVPPPISSAASSTRTDAPPSASATAAASPFGPVPIDDRVVRSSATGSARRALPRAGAAAQLADLDRRPRRARRAWRRGRGSAPSIAEQRLRLDHDHPQLAVLEAALRLDRAAGAPRRAGGRRRSSSRGPSRRRSRRRPRCSPRSRSTAFGTSSESVRPWRCISRKPTILLPAPIAVSRS